LFEGAAVACENPGSGRKCRRCARLGKDCFLVPDDFVERVADLILMAGEVDLDVLPAADFEAAVLEYKSAVEADIRFRRKQGEVPVARTSVPSSEVDVGLLILAEHRRSADALEAIHKVLEAILKKV